MLWVQVGTSASDHYRSHTHTTHCFGVTLHAGRRPVEVPPQYPPEQFKAKLEQVSNEGALGPAKLLGTAIIWASQLFHIRHKGSDQL